MSDVLHIGPLQWEMNLPDGGEISYSDPAYDGFVGRDAQETFSAMLLMPISIRYEARAVPEKAPLYEASTTWAIWEEGNDLIICSAFWNLPSAWMYCRLSRDFSSAELFLDPDREGDEPLLFKDPLRYPMNQILSWGMLARCGGFVLHSAVAVKDGVGWVFSARSGGGKSTLSELCHQAGWKILNDDRVMVFQREGQWRVAGTPWHGTGRFAEAAEVPLGGLFFVEKAEQNEMVPLTDREVRLRLLDVAGIPWFSDEWSQPVLDAVDQFSSESVFQRLRFRKDVSAVEAVEAFVAQQMEVLI